MPPCRGGGLNESAIQSQPSLERAFMKKAITMRKVWASLFVFVAFVFVCGETQSAPPYRIRQGSFLFKHQGCGYNPEGCVWCSITSQRCFLVGRCKNNWCDVWYKQRDPTTTKPDRPVRGEPVSPPRTPPKKTGPGRVDNPPTTVGPPTRKPRPVHPVKPVGVSNPNKTDSGNGGAILLRKNDSGGRQGHGH